MLMKIAGNQIPLAWQQIQFAFNSVTCNNCLRYRMQDLQAVDPSFKPKQMCVKGK